MMAEICYIDITVTEEAKSILFEVKDNGPGIKPGRTAESAEFYGETEGTRDRDKEYLREAPHHIRCI